LERALLAVRVRRGHPAEVIADAPLTCRPRTSEDEPFLFELFAAARRAQFAALPLPPEQLHALLKMQHRAQMLGHRTQSPGADERILLRGGERVGWMCVDRQGPEWTLVDFAVREPGRGLGTLALAGLCAKADAAGRPLALQVARDNRALRLYQRAGFVETGADPVYLQMRRAPRPGPAL
jgi:ribosomal protein S18 acetylase RimI-like enzyme